MTNNTEETLIIWMEGGGYDSDPTLTSSQLQSVNKENKLLLFDWLLNNLLHEGKETQAILNKRGYFSANQLKEQKGIKITNMDAICYQASDFLRVEAIKSDYDIEEYVKCGCPPTMVYVKIDKTSDLFKKIEAEKAKQQKAAEDRKKKQLERKIKKAKKLLEKVEKTS